MEMKQKQTFFHGTYSNLASSFTGHKIGCKSEHKHAELTKIKRDMCKCDSSFCCLQSSTLFE